MKKKTEDRPEPTCYGGRLLISYDSNRNVYTEYLLDQYGNRIDVRVVPEELCHAT